jgi:hypothetical protein
MQIQYHLLDVKTTVHKRLQPGRGISVRVDWVDSSSKQTPGVMRVYPQQLSRPISAARPLHAGPSVRRRPSLSALIGVRIKAMGNCPFLFLRGHAPARRP